MNKKVLTVKEVKELLNIGKEDRIEFCTKCALNKQGWALQDGYEKDYVCPIAYHLQNDYDCPINKYPNREDLCEEIDKFIISSLDSKEKHRLFLKAIAKEE